MIDFRMHYPSLADRTMKVVVEANGRFDGDYIRILISPSRGMYSRYDKYTQNKIGAVEFISDNGIKSGINKTAQRTKEYIASTKDALHEGRFRLHRNFGTSNTHDSLTTVAEDIKKQGLRMRYPDADPDNPRYHGNRRKCANGKTASESDDSWITFMMVAEFSKPDDSAHNTGLRAAGNFIAAQSSKANYAY